MAQSHSRITRRRFATGLALTATLRGQSQENPKQAHWYERIRRLGQLNINEKDAASVDVDRWIRYWADLKVDGLIVSAGGIMAFYPTQLPLHRKSRYMGSRDVFGEYARAARRANIRVIARLDPTYAFPEMFEAHPDWFTRNKAGNPEKHREAKELYFTCMFGTYYDQPRRLLHKWLARHRFGLGVLLRPLPHYLPRKVRRGSSSDQRAQRPELPPLDRLAPRSRP